MAVKVVLAIGGHDPSGGAGVGADMATFGAVGVRGVAVVTALTFQNTQGVAGFWTAGAREVKNQLDALLADVEVNAVKVGMLASEGVARAVTPYLETSKRAGVPIVFDPVYSAGAGQPLFEGVPFKVFSENIIPNATVVTPNVMELASLVDEEPAANAGGLRTQVRVFFSKFRTAVFATGGHLAAEGDVIDILFTGGEMREFRRRRFPAEIHGTGCLLAAALASYLAEGAELAAAAEKAEEYVSAAIAGAVAVGKGALIPDRAAAAFKDADRWRVYNNVLRAVKIFETGANTYKLIPEVGTNIGYALKGATEPDDICAVPGRVARVGTQARAFAQPAFGASGHIARTILAVLKHDPNVRAAMNVRYGEDVIAAARALGYRLASFDRAGEPVTAAKEEGATIAWGVDQAVAAIGAVPDIIYDRGGFGKEPMVRILGPDALEVVRRAMAISRRLA